MANTQYAIASGETGRERLRVVARIFGSGTADFLDTVGIREGTACLDVGCGGGDVSTELARRVGPAGRVLGIDRDAVSLDIARTEASAQHLPNVDYEEIDVFDLEHESGFDAVYSRFLLTHLDDPAAALARMVRALRPGGVVALEDIDFTGHFCDPECDAFREYVRLYTEVVKAKGGDPNIGPRLPNMLRQAGLGDVRMRVSQPADIQGETKLINPITMQCISEAVIAAGLALEEEVSCTVDALFDAARDDRTVLSTPRIVQAWARKG